MDIHVVYTRYIHPVARDIHGISMDIHGYARDIDEDGIILVVYMGYTRNIPCIYMKSGFQMYPWVTTYMVITLGYTTQANTMIPGIMIYHEITGMMK
jgi:hypothetical protein